MQEGWRECVGARCDGSTLRAILLNLQNVYWQSDPPELQRKIE